MAKRGGRRRAEVDALDVRPGGPEAGDAGAVLRRGPAGHAVLLPRALDRLSPRQLEAVEELQDVAVHLAKLREILDGAVEDARDLGVSWNLIGYSVGTSGEAARQRWGIEGRDA